MRIISLFIIVISMSACISDSRNVPYSACDKPEALADQWELVGEAINEPGWDIWGSSPIITDDGQVWYT